MEEKKFPGQNQQPIGADSDGAKATTSSEPTYNNNKQIKTDSIMQKNIDQPQINPFTSKVSDLDKRRIYSQSELSKTYCISIAFLKINRAVLSRNVNKKVTSIEKTKGITTSCLIVSGKECVEAGLAIVDVNGKNLNPDIDLERVAVIIDGQHRFKAIQSHNTDHPEDLYECYFNLPLTDVPVITALRESNVSTNPWKGSDFLTTLILTCGDLGVDMRKINWIQEQLPVCGDTAAWLWANLGGKVATKTEIVKANELALKGAETDLTKLQELADTKNFDYGTKLYEACMSKLGANLVKLKVLPETLSGFVFDEVTGSEGMSTVVPKVENFIKSLTTTEVEALQNIKKKGEETKDAQIKKSLKNLWSAYKKDLDSSKAA